MISLFLSLIVWWLLGFYNGPQTIIQIRSEPVNCGKIHSRYITFARSYESGPLFVSDTGFTTLRCVIGRREGRLFFSVDVFVRDLEEEVVVAFDRYFDLNEIIDENFLEVYEFDSVRWEKNLLIITLSGRVITIDFQSELEATAVVASSP